MNDINELKRQGLSISQIGAEAHCGCSCTHHYVTRGEKIIRYYACLNAMKRLTHCPVGRINTETLHETALCEIDRAARHKTVMHRIIAQSGGWQKPDDARKALRGQIAKKMQFNAVQIANINKAVAGGGSVELPRMADFARIGVAVEQVMAWEPEAFMRPYSGNIEEQHEEAISSSLLGEALRSYLQPGQAWEGNAAELLHELNQNSDRADAKRKGWPANARGLSGERRLLAPNLRDVGRGIEFSQPHGTRLITLGRSNA